MIGLILFLVVIALIGSMLSAIGDLVGPTEETPFEDTDLAARTATRDELRRMGLLRRR
jgi:hypothetical protein